MGPRSRVKTPASAKNTEVSLKEVQGKSNAANNAVSADVLKLIVVDHDAQKKYRETELEELYDDRGKYYVDDKM